MVRKDATERDSMGGGGEMTLNKAKCRLCKDVIESKSVHDYKSCKCGEIFIDGGQTYFGCGAMTDIKNLIRLRK